MGQDDESFPEGLDVRTTEAGGEVSMSLEETNRVREKLGLKPLRTGESDRAKSKREAEEAAHAARADEAKAKQTAEISARIAAAKERRLMEARDRSTKQLGEADEGDDDLAAWVNKSREDEKRRRAEERRKAEELARKLAEQDDDAEDSDEDDGDMFSGGGGSKRARDGAGGYTSKDLAGLKVRHDADEVMEGETMILTLKDSSILDDARTGINEEDDELENVLAAEEKRRKKARKEATKNPGAPFGTDEEEGSKTLLAKYDEKKDGDGLTLDTAGAVSAEEERRKAEIRRKLAASLGGAPANAVEESAAVEKRELSDFLTPAEVAEKEAAKFNKPKKKRRKKLREKKLDAADLEELAPAANELGSRRDREREGGVATAAAERKRAERDANFVSALNKAKMKTDERILAEMAGDAGGGDEEDDELARALERSRRLAVKGTTASVDALVAAAAERRAKDGPSTVNGDEGIVGVAGDAPDSVVFSDVQEFVHGVNAADRRSAPAEPEGSGDVDEMPPPPPVPPPPPPGSGDTEEDLMDHDGMPPPPPPPPTETARPSDLGGVGDSSAPSKGLAATLALLKDTGKLNEGEMWDGRTNDKKPLALMRAREAAAIPSGEFEGRKFDFHLDKFDEFGRKMTPKEAFRDLCHKFHGIEPGKGKKEKRLRQYQEEIKAKKAAEESSKMSAADKMKHVQEIQASPFVVLSGKVHAGQSSDAVSRYGTAGLDADEEAGRASAGGSRSVGASVRGKGDGKVAFSMKTKR